jgi:DNA-binding NtrC family response regulator
MKKVHILLASARAEDRRSLAAILDGTPWRLIETDDRAEAVKTLHGIEVPIVLCDRDLPGSPWQETIRTLIAARTNACVILVSNVADQYLWDEVVQRGGFDVLTRPFHKDQVLSMLDFAHTHWKTGWPTTKV